MADAALHLALFLFGRVVVTVFGQVAELASGLDLAGDLDSTPRREVGVLGFEAVECAPRQPMVLGHTGQASHHRRNSAGQGRKRLGWARG
jgi:hypothetical protein